MKNTLSKYFLKILKRHSSKSREVGKVGGSKVKKIRGKKCLLLSSRRKEEISKTRGEIRTQSIFEKYTKNLDCLIGNGIISKEKGVYICPICLKPHKSIHENDPLSLEDAPPKALGGSAKTLTCTKSCNNKCGVTIDNQLVERFKQLEQDGLFPNTEIPVEIEHKETTVRGILKVGEEREMEFHLLKERNNPNYYKEFTETVEDGEDMTAKPSKRKRLDSDKIQYALLKAAYILFFEKTGYAFIFHKCFDVVREQILNPEKRIIPDKFFFTPPYPKEYNGVYFILDEGIECVFVIFSISSGEYNQTYGVMLPLGNNDLEKIKTNLQEKFKKEKRFLAKLQPITDDFLTDINLIDRFDKWINSIN